MSICWNSPNNRFVVTGNNQETKNVVVCKIMKVIINYNTIVECDCDVITKMLQ